jgi:DNA invertase Pin-like site-specific DNA recombinase
MQATPMQDATMPRRGYPYSRCSDPKQQKGHSLRRQEDWPKKVCEEQGWIYDDVYALVDKGKSAFHRKNLGPKAGLTRFLQLIRRGAIAPGSVLIIENLDRLSRATVKKAQKILNEILESGIWICTRTPFRIYKDEEDSSFIDLLEPLWIMFAAHQESLKKSQRIADLWVRDRAAARSDRAPISPDPPAWLEKTATGYRIIAERAAVVRRMVDLSLAGHGCEMISKRLEEAGVPPITRKALRRRDGGKWCTETIRKIFSNRALVGEYQPCTRDPQGKPIPDGEPIPSFYPALLSGEEWEALQLSRLARHPRRSRHGRPGVARTNLFTGLVTDAVSGEKISLRGIHTNGTKYAYLCRERRQGGLIPYDEFEEALLSTLAMLRPQDVMEQTQKRDQREEQIATLTARLVLLEQRAHDVGRAIEDPENAAAVPTLARSLAAIEADRQATARDRDALKLECASGRSEVLVETQTLAEQRKRMDTAQR